MDRKTKNRVNLSNGFTLAISFIVWRKGIMVSQRNQALDTCFEFQLLPVIKVQVSV